MKKALKILYGLAAVGLGTLISVFLVSLAVSHDTGHSEPVKEDTAFPDYVALFNEYYQSYENRRDHFHQTEERYFLPMSQQENCLTCHSLWPHTKDVRTRSFSNQHTRFMTCMTCHMVEQPGRMMDVEWYNFGADNSITRGGPYGVERTGDGKLLGSDNYISKIVPTIVDGNISNRVFTPYSTPLYAEYRKAVIAGQEVDKDQIRAEAEALVSDEARSCGSCHSESSDFPWEALKFAGDRLNEMRHSAVVGMVEKYDSFYFPPVFE